MKRINHEIDTFGEPATLEEAIRAYTTGSAAQDLESLLECIKSGYTPIPCALIAILEHALHLMQEGNI